MYLLMRSSRRGLLSALLASAVMLAGAAAPARSEDGPPVGAAASLRFALDEIGATYATKTGVKPRFTYGATGDLVQQIEKGAPFQLLLAADTKSVKKLAGENLTEGEPSIFAHGELSLVAPKTSPVTVDSELKGLKEALKAGKVKHFAIANPETAPYGRAAREALQKAGLWETVQPLIVQGENVGQAAQFTTTGAAEAGMIAQSLAIAADMAPKIDAAVLPESTHAPIDHGLAVIKGASEAAKAFASYVKGEEARAVLERNGFAVPAR
jgi:molybdate transport system substrate-binding protein